MLPPCEPTRKLARLGRLVGNRPQSEALIMIMNSAEREVAREHLELANGHVAGGQQRVQAQRDLTAQLERDGHDTHRARTLLAQFEATLAFQVGHRDRILRELADDGIS